MPPACSIKQNLPSARALTGHVGIYHMQAGCRSYAPSPSRTAGFAPRKMRGRGFRKAYNCRAIVVAGKRRAKRGRPRIARNGQRASVIPIITKIFFIAAIPPRRQSARRPERPGRTSSRSPRDLLWQQPPHRAEAVIEFAQYQMRLAFGRASALPGADF